MAEVVSAPRARSVRVGGATCRIWEKGEGAPLGFVAGFGGCPRWLPFLDYLAEGRRVIVPSLPGFPGSDGGHHELDDHLDWISATLDLLERAELLGCDLVGASLGGMLAAELAALSQAAVKRLCLLAPLGLYDPSEPGADPWARTPAEIPTLLSARPDRFAAAFAPDADSLASADWEIEQYRAADAAARLLWPLGERGLAKRLHLVRCPVLLLWGSDDALVPPSYAKLFAERISSPVALQLIEGAGHLLAIDEPELAAEEVAQFLSAR